MMSVRRELYFWKINDSCFEIKKNEARIRFKSLPRRRCWNWIGSTWYSMIPVRSVCIWGTAASYLTQNVKSPFFLKHFSWFFLSKYVKSIAYFNLFQFPVFPINFRFSLYRIQTWDWKKRLLKDWFIRATVSSATRPNSANQN